MHINCPSITCFYHMLDVYANECISVSGLFFTASESKFQVIAYSNSLTAILSMHEICPNTFTAQFLNEISSECKGKEECRRHLKEIVHPRYGILNWDRSLIELICVYLNIKRFAAKFTMT